jgi:uncharacterized damage-inducible protein DinB
LAAFDATLTEARTIDEHAQVMKEARMLADALRTMYRYTGWANRRLLDAAGALTPEQLLEPGVAGRGSVRDTLLHMIGTHRGWLSWWDGSLSAMEAYGQKLDPADYPDIAAIRRAWAEVEQQTLAFVSGLQDDEVGRVLGIDMPNGARWEKTLWGMMLHVANHGTQHRSEVAAMLTGFGHSPGDLDLITYLDLSPE